MPRMIDAAGDADRLLRRFQILHQGVWKFSMPDFVYPWGFNSIAKVGGFCTNLKLQWRL